MARDDASRRPGRLGVGIVGAGRVGSVLGAALRSAGHAVVGVSGVSEASRERAENLLPGVLVLEVPDIIERAELVLLTVPDDALPTLVEGLARLNAWQPGQLVVHTSGRYGTSVLGPARAAGAIPLAIHPAMTFTGLSLDLGRLPDSMFGITAQAAVLPIAQALVVEMGAESVVIEEESRALYHAALSHASNHLVTIAAQSAQLLADLGVQHPDRLLGPLMKASLENALSSGEGALSGPVARGDAGTVRAHRAALEAHDAPDTRQAYLGMARATALRALERGVLSAAQGEAILAALADVPGADGPPGPSPEDPSDRPD